MATHSGLDGVVAATTRLSHVDGEQGELLIAGFPVGELAAHATFEETMAALARDLPTQPEPIASARI
jgi:citrate synthase